MKTKTVDSYRWVTSLGAVIMSFDTLERALQWKKYEGLPARSLPTFRLIHQQVTITENEIDPSTIAPEGTGTIVLKESSDSKAVRILQELPGIYRAIKGS